jgi:hypothetical protein
MHLSSLHAASCDTALWFIAYGNCSDLSRSVIENFRSGVEQAKAAQDQSVRLNILLNKGR